MSEYILILISGAKQEIRKETDDNVTPVSTPRAAPLSEESLTEEISSPRSGRQRAPLHSSSESSIPEEVRIYNYTYMI